MQIRTVSLIGLGAVGAMVGQHLAQHMPAIGLSDDSLRIIADAGRIERYRRDGIYSNGQRCGFHYVTPDEDTGPVDLLMIVVKARDLPDAIRAVRHQVGPDTILLSLLNGIHSEREIAQTYGEKNVLLCTAQGMDATKTGNQLTYDHMGYLAIGERTVGSQAEKVQRVAEFFGRTALPYRIIPDMWRHMWSKFMLNAGINQVIAVYQGNYSLIQQPGEARDLMVAAMREVAALSEPEGIFLGEKDIENWLALVDTLGPQNKPSMSQDLEAGRPTEVDLFAGTALALGEKHDIPTPVNRMLYDRIREMEAAL